MIDGQRIVEKPAIADVIKIAEEYIRSNQLDIKLTSGEYVSDSDDIKLILYFTTESEPNVPKEWGDDWNWVVIDSWWGFAYDLVNIFKFSVKLTRVPQV